MSSATTAEPIGTPAVGTVTAEGTPSAKAAVAPEDDSALHFFGEPLVGFDPSEITGSLIVIEGMDGSGRSTQITLLQEWLESEGFAVQTSGLRRSNLVGRDIDVPLVARHFYHHAGWAEILDEEFRCGYCRFQRTITFVSCS